jgi:hypothetical protein
MTELDLAIVVAGYDRPQALSRLLDSMGRVVFDGHRVPLVLSLDHSGNGEVARVAESFVWAHGKKLVRTFPGRLGLKRHLLACGDLTRDHEHLVVLEDDLYVSPNLYRYVVQALARYGDDARIAGLGLYSHLWNESCHRPFLPLEDGSDAYFVQYACSWGQVWSRATWVPFREWLDRENGAFPPGPAIPDHVAAWSDHSWLKHHIRYCIETDRYFVYPRVALATNFSDEGQHHVQQETGYQVPLQVCSDREFRFPSLETSRAVYDAFFESQALAGPLGVPAEALCVDLYGAKGNRAGRRFWLTPAQAPFRILRTFGLALRPHEANVLEAIPGESIRLYDTAEPARRQASAGLSDALVKYDVRNVSYKSLLRYSTRFALRRLRAKLLGKP